MAKQPESDHFLDMFSRFGRDLKLPNVDVQAFLDHHRKNLEALEKSARASAAGASAVMSKQSEVIQQAMREITQMAHNYQAPASPQDFLTRQAEFARRSFETAVKTTSEVADLARKSGTESIEILRDRIRDAMAEIRAGYDKK
ncbi:phasin family protein [Mesorhizobium sp. CU2]|uniref:phasin family protein n=1 Tax=unclassified Mesorhizobium TaxID=325217 RepID=UPI00112EB343|nr:MULTISPECIES: TIGR01841 family phasin [unclassified Mesorhizobium]TPN88585.1 phasin family protein [Mesorhizobium sp. CU3]TPO21582.1 phasin family protein [Mesorhizobium sp. CU2]